MVPTVRRLFLLLVLAGVAGCSGKSQNPSYFPWFLRTGDITRTHGKPPGAGYYANFDPHAVRLEVRPLETTSAVRAHQVLIATVYDAQGKPRRNRRVEWMVEGVGNIIEVDESGYHDGRGYKIDNRYAISYTNYFEHLNTRGNTNARDDFQLRPGQSWCVISSAVEGDTQVTVYAPEIHNWENNKTTVAIRWVDAGWVLPQPAPARAGTQQVLTTTVLRHTDKQPLAGYYVRYRVLDGPPATFADTRGQEAEVVSDLRGHANVTLVQAQPQQGANRIGIEIIRPRDPTTPSGVGVTIGRGEVVQQWLGPAIALNLGGPPTASVGQEFTYTIAVSNPGQIETQAQTVRMPMPEGVRYVRSQPAAAVDGNVLTWTLGTLGAGQMHSLQATFAASRPGPVSAVTSVATLEGLREQRTATMQITSPQLKVTVTGPNEGTVDAPFSHQITVTNGGDGPAGNVTITAELSEALEHAQGTRKVTMNLGTLGAGQSRTVPLALTPRKVGELVTRLTATADGNLTDTTEKPILVRQVRMSLDIKGPKIRYVDRPAEWTILATNTGEMAVSNVVLKADLPPELALVGASDGAQAVANGVAWNLGTLQPKDQREVKVMTNPVRMAARVTPTATVSATPNLVARAQAELEIRGLPALSTRIEKVGDPVPVGGRITYHLLVTNTGTLPSNDVAIQATLPPELRFITSAGPTQGREKGGQVVFPPVNGLQPKQSIRYSIEAEALKIGDVRFEAKVSSDALASLGAVTKQESTRIYESSATVGGESKATQPR